MQVTYYLENAVRKHVLQMAYDIIDETPVDSGKAKNNWQVSLNTSIEELLGSADTSGQVAKDAAQNTLEEFQLGDSIFITNNVPYIGKLESGYSRQGNSMVARAVRKFNDQ